MDERLVCLECGDVCTTVEETFGYGGTHCTFGRPGTHHTGRYVSECCLGEVQLYDDWLTSQEIKLATQ